MTATEFSAAVGVLIEDDTAVKRASIKDLLIVSSVLTAIVGTCEKELRRREKVKARGQMVRKR